MPWHKSFKLLIISNIYCKPTFIRDNFYFAIYQNKHVHGDLDSYKQDQRNLSGNYYTESLMGSSLARGDKYSRRRSSHELGENFSLAKEMLVYSILTEVLKHKPSCVALQAPSQWF